MKNNFFRNRFASLISRKPHGDIHYSPMPYNYNRESEDVVNDYYTLRLIKDLKNVDFGVPIVWVDNTGGAIGRSMLWIGGSPKGGIQNEISITVRRLSKEDRAIRLNGESLSFILDPLDLTKNNTYVDKPDQKVYQAILEYCIANISKQMMKSH